MRVLVVGLGSIAKKHISALRKICPQVTIYGFRSSSVAEEMEGVINIFDLGQVPKLAVDFVIISNPTENHKTTIKDLLIFQIPLFIEKPLFDSIQSDSINILQIVQERKIKTYIACNLRFLDCLVFVKDFIRNVRINEVNSYCGSYLPDWRPGQDFRKVYSANKEMGGGVHLDLIHEIDYVYWLFGPPNKVLSVKTSNSSLDISATDYANFLFQYPQFCANIILNYYRKEAKRSLEIVLDNGVVYADLLNNTVTYDGEIIYSSRQTVLDTYEEQLRFFIDEILDKGTEFNTMEEAFGILKLCIGHD